MSTHLCITVRWIGDRFHGFVDGTETIEWPPSPFRLFQALVAGAHRYGLDKTKHDALAWIERQGIAPDVLASPQPLTGTIFDHWVPDNDNLPNHRRGSIRKFCPVLLEAIPLVHYLWQIDPLDQPPVAALDDLTSTLSSLGWAIDQAYAVVALASAEQIDVTIRERDRPSRFRPAGKTISPNGSLRVPKPGSICDLEGICAANRTAAENQAERRRKKWPKVFDRVFYTSAKRPIGRPYRVFELRTLDGLDRYPQAKLIHVAGMVRHLAIEAMKDKRNWPRDVKDEDWAKTYIAGHRKGGKADPVIDNKCRDDVDEGRQREVFEESGNHQQLSYLPLPSVGHEHTDPGVRRVMIAAPVGDDAWLAHVARRLGGQQLKALNERRPEFGEDENGRPKPGPILVALPRTGDGVTRRYTDPSSVWHSFTPVILPGHDDHKAEKTRKLIEKALAQSGIEQPCEFEWSAFSRFPKSFSAHKYDKHKQPQGYIRPTYLNSQTAVHLTLRFHDGSDKKNPVAVPGPITVGAGRHCGLGLFAVVESS